MKKYIILLLACAGWYACQSPATKTRDFIPGTYTGSASGEFSSVRDTLVFARLDQSHFELVRRTAYQAIRNGKPLALRHQVRAYKTLWDPLKQELTEETSGLFFRFDADKRIVIVGKAIYHKLN